MTALPQGALEQLLSPEGGQAAFDKAIADSQAQTQALMKPTVAPNALRRPCASIVATAISAPPSRLACFAGPREPSRSLVRSLVRSASLVVPATIESVGQSLPQGETTAKPRVRVVFSSSLTAPSLFLSRFTGTASRSGVEFFLR